MEGVARGKIFFIVMDGVKWDVEDRSFWYGDAVGKREGFVGIAGQYDYRWTSQRSFCSGERRGSGY